MPWFFQGVGLYKIQNRSHVYPKCFVGDRHQPAMITVSFSLCCIPLNQLRTAQVFFHQLIKWKWLTIILFLRSRICLLIFPISDAAELIRRQVGLLAKLGLSSLRVMKTSRLAVVLTLSFTWTEFLGYFVGLKLDRIHSVWFKFFVGFECFSAVDCRMYLSPFYRSWKSCKQVLGGHLNSWYWFVYEKTRMTLKSQPKPTNWL